MSGPKPNAGWRGQVLSRQTTKRLATLFAAVLLTLGVSGGATAALPSSGGSATPATGVVHTAQGAVKGVVTEDYQSYFDLPFAKAPVGSLRWQPPVPAASWSGVRDATQPGPECAQAGGDAATSSEDCLNLNVWAPGAARKGAKLPVAVWIYGGAFRTGAANDYRPVSMVEQGNMIVVTINYRLGALGFLTLPELDAANGTPSGDYGLLDQVQALRWVKRNIAQFGGDPGRVTVAGQSAGGESVCNLLASPPAAGLFQSAIVESGLSCVQNDRATAQHDDAPFTTALGCSTGTPTAVAACLRGKPAADILKAQTAAGQVWYPTTGIPALPQQPADAFRSGSFNQVPVVIGSTSAEGAAFVYQATDAIGQPITAAGYKKDVETTFGTDAAAVLARYPLSKYPVPGAAEAALRTDVGFSCATLSNAAALSKSVPTYVYEFRDKTAAGNVDGAPQHAAELPYLWGTSGTAKLTAAQLKLSQAMISYWSTFVRTSRTDPPGLPRLPRYTPSTPRELAFNSGGPALVDDESQLHQCGFWNQYFDDGWPFHFNPGKVIRLPL